jgi:hypothetical protein
MRAFTVQGATTTALVPMVRSQVTAVLARVAYDFPVSPRPVMPESVTALVGAELLVVSVRAELFFAV